MSFFKTRLGLVCSAAFLLLMAFALQRVAAHRRDRASAPPPVAVAPAAPEPSGSSGQVSSPAVRSPWLAENLAYLDQYRAIDKPGRETRDRQGIPLRKRESGHTPTDAGRTTELEAAPAAAVPLRTSLRLAGRTSSGPTAGASAAKPASFAEKVAPPADPPATTPASAAVPPKRFNPFGRVIKCELVFTIDSTNEQTPLVSVVMEPVYNNGQLVIPAGAELHGIARPDRLRDRIFSGQDWVLVFPRQAERINGRQLNVKGVALDRIEPDANGLTWGITDGSYGLQGEVIRTMQDEEIKRFVATFLSAGVQTLEDRDTGRGRETTIRNTPQNAVLQGLSANLEQIAQNITAEIERNGVFIRVPAGHQFYFYPMQIIDSDAAAVSADVATVK